MGSIIDEKRRGIHFFLPLCAVEVSDSGDAEDNFPGFLGVF